MYIPYPFDLLCVSSNFVYKLTAVHNPESSAYLLELIYYMINHVVTMSIAPFYKKETTLYLNHVEYFNY